MDELQPVSKDSRRPRISLLTALLLMTIVGMAVVLILLWREVGPLREEVRRLRDETGVLTVEDPAKLHAIQVDTRDQLLWKWRVWIPSGRVYVIRSTGDSIPEKGYPTDGGSIWIREPGEYVIEYRVDQDRREDKWYGKLKAGGGGVGHDLQPWVDWPSKTSTSGGVSTSTQSFEPGARVELMRHRVSQAQDTSKIEDSAAGFMIWLEPGK